jgi:hypothetical protein
MSTKQLFRIRGIREHPLNSRSQPSARAHSASSFTLLSVASSFSSRGDIEELFGIAQHHRIEAFSSVSDDTLERLAFFTQSCAR